MKKKVLLVEDARDVQLLVRNALGDQVQLTWVETTDDALKELQSRDYALMLLDVNLPDSNGFEFCRRLREKSEFKELPIFFLTGKNETEHKVVGFKAGADDYVTKPFEAQELEARVMAKLNRELKDTGHLQTDGFRVDLHHHQIFQKQSSGEEKLLPLTPLEFRLLSLFLRHEGRIFSRQELVKLFWGGVVVSRNTVDTHISSLRKKLGSDGKALKSTFRKGYSFTRAKETKPTTNFEQHSS